MPMSALLMLGIIVTGFALWMLASHLREGE